ncbi:hypothetical protein [Azospirillum sp. sgz301742]
MSISIPADVAMCLHYYDGMFLTAQGMALEQRFFLGWLALQNRMLYTAGVLEGLEVTAAADGKSLSIASGGAFDTTGRFLVVTDGGAALSVPAGTATPCYVHLTFPANPPVKGEQKNLAAVAQIGASETVADNGILLAQVTLNAAGTIVGIIDRREPARSRLPAAALVGGAPLGYLSPP